MTNFFAPDIKKSSKDTALNVVEEFCSIQGESSYTGRLCYFIRLAGCNLSCSYCDTLYAKKANDGKITTIDEILQRVLKSKFQTVEITGGEPLLQTKPVIELCKKLLEHDITVLIETNGSISIKNIPEDVVKIIDIKTPSSNEGKSFNINNVDYLAKHDQIKFVIGSSADYDFAVSYIKKYSLADKVNELLFSPMWTKVEPSQIVEWLVKDNIKNCRIQLQIHKIIWHPDEQGV
ncbi:radical SAM protein [Lentisphaerota bacterium WC36G]|nr:4Fe-4S cluster-binding domain-containing protein [Lentisphaerae bacterium WC36]